jgi:hypothetical protein
MKHQREDEKGNIEWQRYFNRALIPRGGLPKETTAKSRIKKSTLLCGSVHP